MAQSLSKILVHTVFSTKDREPLLDDADLLAETHAFLGGVLTRLDCQPLIVGGVADHVHILHVLGRTKDIAEVVKEVKRVSSSWLKTRGPGLEEFSWQNGYGAFSIGASQVPRVRRYIESQADHHRRMTFQDEFRGLLRRYDVPFNERYVWD